MENTDKISLKTLVEDLRKEWNLMWWERVDDKLRAEGIATKDYSKLFIERGLIISATKDFKPLEFSDIVRQHVSKPESERWIPPNPSVGGWRKFIREALHKQGSQTSFRRRQRSFDLPDKSRSGPSKKGGRGWLHV